MKIAQVVSTYPPYNGGMGAVAFEYTERLRDRGHHVHVYTPKGSERHNDPKYVHRLVSPLSYGNASLMPSLFARLSGFEIIHLHYPFFGGAEPTIVRKAIRKDQALVMTYHMDNVADGFKGMAFSMHRKILFPWISSRADRILVSTRGYAKDSALSTLNGVEEKIEIHPFGVDLEKFHPGESAVRTKFGIPNEDVLLLFVGGLDQAHYFKGVPVLLEALKNIEEKNWSCIIVGEGDMRQDFEKLAKDLGIDQKVKFTGTVSNHELPDIYRGADIHLFPSTEKGEAFGLVAVEAAASGIPTIASKLSGVSEVVLDAETGLLVEPKNSESLANAISLLIRDEDLRKRLGFSARKRAEAEFAWQPLISRLEETYRSVFEKVKPV